MWLISYNGENQMTFLLIIIVTLNSNLCLFHYKSFVIFYCFYMIILSCRTESKLRYSKKTLWLNHHFMALLSSATQTHLYRTKNFRGLKFATNLQQLCTIFSNFLEEHEADVEARGIPRCACLALKRVDHSAESCWTTVFFQIMLLLLVNK